MIVQKSLVEMACDEIKRLIAHGELVGGDRIREIEFSELLGVSRPPLREALRTLAAQHVLEFSPRKGYKVIGLSAEDAEELFSLRIAIEEFGWRLLFDRLDEVDFAPLHEPLAKMREAAAQEDETGVGDMHREFHVRLIALAGHRRLTQSYAALMASMELYMAMSIADEAASGALQKSAERHAELLAALETRDRPRIEAQLREHTEIYSVDGLPHEGEGATVVAPAGQQARRAR